MSAIVLGEGSITGDRNGARICGARRKSGGVSGGHDGHGCRVTALSWFDSQSTVCVDESLQVDGLDCHTGQNILWGLNGAAIYVPRAELAKATAGMKYFVIAIVYDM